MTDAAFLEDFRRTVDGATDRLLAFSDEEAARRPAPDKWSRKEIIGHLIDSASNNHGRFVRAQMHDHLSFAGYDQDAWVRIQRYQDRPWADLVRLWQAYNHHIAHIMGQSMEALIHHFKLVTEGFRVPAGQVYQAVESPRGELGCHAVSDGGTRPYRVHFRDPSFTNLQSVSAMCEGGMIADVIAAVASIDPVMGGVDR